jgi:hypothetical protein
MEANADLASALTVASSTHIGFGKRATGPAVGDIGCVIGRGEVLGHARRRYMRFGDPASFAAWPKKRRVGSSSAAAVYSP